MQRHCEGKYIAKSSFQRSESILIIGCLGCCNWEKEVLTVLVDDRVEEACSRIDDEVGRDGTQNLA